MINAIALIMVKGGVEGSPCLLRIGREILRLRRPSFVPAALSFGVGSAQDDSMRKRGARQMFSEGRKPW